MAENIEYSIKLADGFTIYAKSEILLALQYAENKNRPIWGKLNDISKGAYVEKAIELIHSVPVESVIENGQEVIQRIEPIISAE